MADRAGIDAGRLKGVSRWMEGHVAAGHVAGMAVQIAHQGRVVYDKRRGLADIEAERAVADDTIWRMYSMTKPITCFAALRLYEQGAFRMDQPAAEFLPGLGDGGVWVGGMAAAEQVEPLRRPVTVHDLFTHQAGLVYPVAAGNAVERAFARKGLSFGRAGESMADVTARLKDVPLLFQPGAHWHYSIAHDVLGRVIEVITGETLGAALARLVFEPLGMVDTGFGLTPEQEGRLAACYEPGPGGLQRMAEMDDPKFRLPVKMERGGGGLFSTIDDYQRFATMLLRRGKGLLGRKTFEAMVTNQIGGPLAAREWAPCGDPTYEGRGYGLGVGVMLEPGRTQGLGSVGDFGWNGWASTMFWVDPEEELVVIAMTQLVPHGVQPLLPELRALAYQALV